MGLERQIEALERRCLPDDRVIRRLRAWYLEEDGQHCVCAETQERRRRDDLPDERGTLNLLVQIETARAGGRPS